MNGKVMVGLALALAGLLMFILAFPLLTESTKELLDDQDGRLYKSYDPGDQVYVGGELEAVFHTSQNGWYSVGLAIAGVNDQTVCELDVDAPDDKRLFFLIPGNHTDEVFSGFDIWAQMTLEKSGFLTTIEYWTVAGPNDVHLQFIAKGGFLLVSFLGVAVLVWGLVSGRRKH